MSDDGLKDCRMVFAQNGLVLTSGSSKICRSCLRLHTVESNHRKRKVNQTTDSPTCNKRFIQRTGQESV